MGYDRYGDLKAPRTPVEPKSAGKVALSVLAVFGLLIAAWLLLNFMTSFKGTDTGSVCVVKEGGPFDGRDVKTVRKPGEGPRPIGIFNDQLCYPATQRDSNDIIDGTPTFPTKDSVQVVADDQILFTLTQDPRKLKEFHREYGSRSWGGKELFAGGWINFLRERFQPIVLDATREAIGTFECTQLNNLCQYVQNAEEVAQGKVKAVNNSQNLSAACKAIREALVGTVENPGGKLRQAFGDDYFENVRCQNLRIRFQAGVQEKINEAQSLRTQAANAKLEATRKVAEAKGDADRKVEQARGARAAAFQQSKAYKANPTQAEIDKIEAFCGADGCDPQVIGGSLNGIISSLGGAK